MVFITLFKNHEEVECQNTVKGKMHRVLRFQDTKQRAFCLTCICSLDCFWTLFQASCVTFYIQFIRHVYSFGYLNILLLYPESGNGPLPCFYTFPDIIHRMCQTIVFHLFCLETILKNSHPVNI